MSRRLFYRNVHARDHLEVFLVSAVTALLALRFYLHATGYPQVGGATLHIAHMLYGGLLMLAAIVINLSFLGLRAQKVSAVVGGAGFGIFIDELGILYLLFNFISRRQRLSSAEYQLNALQQLEEAIRHDMDRHEKAALRDLLAKADQQDPLTQELKAMAGRIKPVKAEPNWYSRWLDKVGHTYDRFWRQRGSNQAVAAIFILEALIFLGVVVGNLTHSFDSVKDLLKHTDRYSTRLLIGQLGASAVASVFAIIGAFQMTGSRLEAYEWFRRALLTNLFLTEFFIFSRVQFAALPGFAINLLLLIALRAALFQERRRS
jgi:hypothetical protein